MNRKQQKPRSGQKAPATKARRRGKSRRRRSNRLPAVFALALFAVALVPVFFILFGRTDAARSASAPIAEEAGMPLVTLQPQVTAEPTATPTPEPTPTPVPTPEPTATPTPEPTPFEYLPVIHRADIQQNRIAVTVDDCYQLENLKTIVSVAEGSGAKLTLFPVGENLGKSGMAELLRRCAFDLGFEIENHTWSHDRIFRLPDDEMAAEIWKQSAALNQALGMNYQQHFLRLMGGDGDTDPRIHSYLKQMGYLGIANWSYSGSDSDLKHIKNALAPGQVYLFHCTDPDTKKLKEFIPWAVSQGYELVTLNELFNLPANQVSALTDQVMPQPQQNVDDHHTLKAEEYTWVVARLQDRLREMGYLELDGPSTGYYGEQTAKAVAAFQQDNGLPVTGEADAATQERILEG